MSLPVFRETGKRRREGFVERSLTGVNEALERSLFADRIARQRGLLQTLDPRLKLVATLALLVAVSLSRNPGVLAALYLSTLALAAASKIPLEYFVRRAWLAVLLFTGMIALPALFLTPGPAWLHLPLGLTLTQTGATSALFLLLRVGASVSLAALLVLTTPWNSVLKALGVLGLPGVVVLVFGMTYRYIHLLLHLTSDMFLSRKSRLIRPPAGAEQRRLAAAMAGVLLGKSLQISSEVYLAMESRGYRGYPRTLDTFHFTRRDWIAAGIVLAVAAAAVWLGR